MKIKKPKLVLEVTFGTFISDKLSLLSDIKAHIGTILKPMLIFKINDPDNVSNFVFVTYSIFDHVFTVRPL